MNILILNWRDPKNPKSGGAEKVTMEHARAWVSAGHTVTWFSSSFAGAKENERIDNVEIVRRGNYLSVYIFAPFFYLFSKRSFDVVIDEIHGLPFLTPLYVRKPKIALIHEVAGEIWSYMFPFPMSLIGKFIESLYFNLYKNVKFWVPSKSTLDDLVKMGIKRKNITLIYCGLDIKPLLKVPNKEKIPTFIFVSRIVKMKGVEEVIKSFFFILKELKDGNLWIVGDGDPKYINYLKEILKSYSISSKVKFFGKVSEKEKVSLLQKSNLILHASRKEGWGLVIIEAASQATPAVVYDVAGLRDSVINGKTGVVIHENKPEVMARAAIDLISNKSRYTKYQKNCLKWAKSLDWDKSTKISLELIENVTKNN
ncbi:MAG TPA: glycosyltransferase family 4 protein [Patescibacteria group bacterium]|nr:glycosyltransferase family 4 protein [Patescibacteria group bacterium]